MEKLNPNNLFLRNTLDKTKFKLANVHISIEGYDDLYEKGINNNEVKVSGNRNCLKAQIFTEDGIYKKAEITPKFENTKEYVESCISEVLQELLRKLL